MVAGPFVFRLHPMKHIATLVLLCLAVVAGSAADTIYVHPMAELGGDGQSWNAPLRNLAIAMTTAQPGDELWLASGTFRLGATLKMKNGVRIYGGFTGNETLRERRDWFRRPSILESSGATSLISMDDLDSTTRLDGIVLQGATGSAVIVEGGAPVFFNCLFRNNAGEFGGAIRATGVTRVRMEFCSFVQNSATTAGGAVYLDSVLTSPNYAYGPFIGECLFDRNTVPGGVGGAIYINRSEGSIPQIVSSVFSSNSAMYGGAVATMRTFLYMTNNTISRNTLSTAGKGVGRSLLLNGGWVQNTIVWGGDTADTTRHIVDVDQQGGDTTKLTTQSCMVENDPDLGFWTSDPLFVNIDDVNGPDGFFGTDDDGLRLTKLSRGNDVGVIDGFVNHQNCDAIGNPRLVGRRIDAGAYEAQRSGRTGFREVMDELRTGKMVVFFRHAKTDWGQKDPGPSPECFPGRNLIYEGREQSREIGKHWISLGVSVGDAFSSPVCRCWETMLLMAGRYEKKSHWASGGTPAIDSARMKDLKIEPTNGNRMIISHDAVANYVFNPNGDGGILTTAEIMEGDAVILRPTGDTMEVLAQWCSDTWERYYVRFPEVTSVSDDPTSVTSTTGLHASPNPAGDQLQISNELNEPLRIYDVMGRVVADIPASMNVTVDVSTWTPGMYQIVGVTSGSSITSMVSR